MNLNKILILVLVFLSTSSAIEFKEENLETFKLQGISKKISFEKIEQRDKQIEDLWKKLFLNYKFYSHSKDLKIYAVYTQIKKNSFEYFLGIKSDKKIDFYKEFIVNKNTFYKGSFIYTKNLNFDKLRNKIESKIKRNNNLEFEVYKIEDLQKDSYRVELFIKKEKK